MVISHTLGVIFLFPIFLFKLVSKITPQKQFKEALGRNLKKKNQRTLLAAPVWMPTASLSTSVLNQTNFSSLIFINTVLGCAGGTSTGGLAQALPLCPKQQGPSFPTSYRWLLKEPLCCGK